MVREGLQISQRRRRYALNATETGRQEDSGGSERGGDNDAGRCNPKYKQILKAPPPATVCTYVRI